jgi:hypothetical protein
MAVKPLKNETFLVENLLIGLAVLLALLGFVLSEYNVAFWYGPWGYVTHGEVKQPIILGVVPLANLGYFLSFLFLYLLFEFYGFKHAFYTTLTLGLLILATYGTFEGLKWLHVETADEQEYRELKQFLTYSLKDIYSIVAAIILGHTTTFLLAVSLRRLTHNYFMFFRFTIAATCGFTVFVAVRIYLLYWQTLAPMSMLMMAATPLAQFLTGILLALVPLYILRLVLGIFRGHSKISSDEVRGGKKGVFRTADSDVPPPPPPQRTYHEPQPNQAFVQGPTGGRIIFPATTGPEETSVSQKIHFEHSPGVRG